MTRDKILALDLATRWGWAILYLDGRLLAWGVSNCPPTKKITRWRSFRRQLDLVVSSELADEIQTVVWEKPITYGARGRSAAAARVTFGLVAHVEHWTEVRGIPEVAEYAPATVKKQAAGHGFAKKIKVAAAVAQRYPGRGFEGLIETGPWDGTDAVAVGITHLAS